MRAAAAALVIALVAGACANSDGGAAASEPATTGATPPAEPPLITLPRGTARDFGPSPTTPIGPLDPATLDAVDIAFGQRLLDDVIDDDRLDAIDTIGASGDPRTAWWLTDLLRVTFDVELAEATAHAFTELTGVDIHPRQPSWREATDHLLAWDLPEPPDYLRYKRNVLLAIEPRWEPLLVDESDIDWRLVSWGGVLIDDRPYDQTDDPCNCIPAADNPRVVSAAEGDRSLHDGTVVFGVEINGEARAYPRTIMEVRELVNDTLGGRDFAMPYCSLCGSAQVFFTDDLPDGLGRPIMRTSGLLSRSNKVMYDLRTRSVFDTFRGAAVSGPLWEAGIVLEQNGVVTTTWGEWKADHPDTTIVDVDEALGRGGDLRNTRDADGPIFPIGQVDPRLPVQEDVLGLLTADGRPIAFHVASALAAIERGERVLVDGITIVGDGGGVRAVDAAGNDLGGHQAFWFAWSQFHPDTDLWPG